MPSSDSPDPIAESSTGDDLLSRFGRMLADHRQRRRILSWLRLGIRLLTVAIMIGFVAFQASLQWIGEHNPTTAFLLYLPPLLWVIPPLLWLPVALLGDWRSGIALLVLLVVHPFWHLDYRWRPPMELGSVADDPETASRTLTVLNWNRGQASGSLQPFMRQADPDVILMQEAGRRLAGYMRDEAYQFEHGKTLGEFMLLSRFPILSANPVHGETVSRDGTTRQILLAARFEIDFNGRSVALYNVHFPTHRDVLNWHKRGAFLSGIVGLVPGTPFAESRRRHQTYWDRVIQHAETLAEAIENDPLPVVVAGDFNAPHRGVVHRRVARTLTDAHRAAGHGFGFTLPGQTRNPLSLGGPWMRIDKILAGEEWTITGHMTERDRGSQHRAIASRMVLQQENR